MSVRSVVVGLAAAVMAACSAAPAASPTTAPAQVYTCTPPAGPATPHVCSKESYDKQQARLALEAEALQVYDRYATEYWRLVFAGGTEVPTAELDATIANPFRENIASLLARQKGIGAKPVGQPAVVRGAVDRVSSIDGSLVALITCEDSRGATMLAPDGSNLGDGHMVVATRYFKRVDGQLRIFANVDGVQTQCPL